MKAIILDIETAGDLSPAMMESIEAEAQQQKPPSNYKDPAKIEAYLAEAKAKHIAAAVERAALSPLTGRVVCVTVAVEGEDGWSTTCIGPDGPGSAMPERELLDRSMAYLAKADAGCRVVTYNGTAFDLPFLSLRCMVRGIASPWCIPRPKGDYARHLDLFETLGKPGSLDKVCLAVLGDGKGAYTGRDVGESWKNARFSEIREYATREMRLMIDLYSRWREATGNL
jgi:DNA polymerase elongation subunit (family B)